MPGAGRVVVFAICRAKAAHPGINRRSQWSAVDYHHRQMDFSPPPGMADWLSSGPIRNQPLDGDQQRLFRLDLDHDHVDSSRPANLAAITLKT